MSQRTPIKIEALRGGVVESTHEVVAEIVDTNGKTVNAWGNIGLVTYPRSAIKMLQAVSFVESGALEKFNLEERFLSLACASHAGEKQHIELIKEWLFKIGQNESCLICGGHYPMHEVSAHEMIRHNHKPTAIHNNCAGKHLAIISTCLSLGEDYHAYEKYEHVAQVRLRKTLTELTKIDHSKMAHGVDGCGIPTYSLPLHNMALGMASLISDAGTDKRRAVTERILKAVKTYPLLMSGSEEFAKAIIEKSEGRSIVKGGAEGVYCGVLPEKGLAFAVKAYDGAARAAKVATAAILLKLGGLTEREFLDLKDYTQPTVKNWSGQDVGIIRIGH